MVTDSATFSLLPLALCIATFQNSITAGKTTLELANSMQKIAADANPVQSWTLSDAPQRFINCQNNYNLINL